MKSLKEACVYLVVTVVVLVWPWPSFAAEKTTISNEGRYHLISAQYEDKNGNVHPIVYRIDTATGETNYVDNVVVEISGVKTTFFVFGQVYKWEEFSKLIDALKKIPEKK